MVGLEELNEDALVKILSKPKNSIAKQYAKLFEIDGVELEFTDDALVAVAKKSIERKTGARGLRSIMEETMTEIMYEIPSNKDIKKVIVNADTINNKAKPTCVLA